MRDANGFIAVLVERIEEEHKPLIIFGFLPLTKQNVVKTGVAIGAAIGAALFNAAASASRELKLTCCM